MSSAELLSVDDLIERCYDEQWTDGLPVVPPTPALVERMLERSPYATDHELGPVPPRNGIATMEVLATNAVMAGCRPEYFPLVVAAAEAVLDPAFNLNGVQATTHNCTPLLLVTGPVVEQLGINAGAGCFGAGYRANATVGRAIRLLMANTGGGAPGVTDQSTFGHPGKFTYCIGERAERNPWPSFGDVRGFSGESTVTAFAGEAPHHVHDHTNRSPHRIAGSITEVMNTPGNNNTWLKGELVVVVGPEHAATFAEAGWSREDLQYFLFDKARRTIAQLRRGGRWTEETFPYWPRWVDITEDDERLPIVAEPQDIFVFVAGGDAGRFSAFIPGWGALGTSAVTRAVAMPS